MPENFQYSNTQHTPLKGVLILGLFIHCCIVLHPNEDGLNCELPHEILITDCGNNFLTRTKKTVY